MVVSTEWTVEIETCDGLAASERELERFSDALVADERIKEPLAALHSVRGVLSVVFDVDAETSADAAAVAEEAVVAAIVRAGIVARRTRAIARVVTTRLS